MNTYPSTHAPSRAFSVAGRLIKTRLFEILKTVVILSLATPVLAQTAPGPSKGIAIAGLNQDSTSVLMSTGGHSQELQDVHKVLSGYGKPSDDGTPHPEAMIYPGIPYLTPWKEAERRLGVDPSYLSNSDKIACAGFPEGLSWVRYDGHWNVWGHPYNHLILVKDIGNQVVSLEFLHEHGSWVEPMGWTTLPGNWHLMDYVDAEVKGQPQMHIVTQVLDQRKNAHRIVIHTTEQKIGRTAMWFVPQPLINIMLYCTRGVR